MKDTTKGENLESIKELGAALVECEHIIPDNFGWNSLAKNLEGIISEEDAKNLITSFDVIGDIAAIEIPYPTHHPFILPFFR